MDELTIPVDDILKTIEIEIEKLKTERDSNCGMELRVYDFKNGGISALNALSSMVELWKSIKEDPSSQSKRN